MSWQLHEVGAILSFHCTDAERRQTELVTLAQSHVVSQWYSLRLKPKPWASLVTSLRYVDKCTEVLKWISTSHLKISTV